MRTIRTKVYKFSELSESMQSVVIEKEAKRFNAYFHAVADKGYLNQHELDAAKDRIIRHKQEFTKDGKMI